VSCSYSWIRKGWADYSLSYSRSSNLDHKRGAEFSLRNNFARVSCSGGKLNNAVYKNVHFWVTDYPKTGAKAPSVLILEIESLSRLSFLRFIPKTKQLLDNLKN